MTHTLRISSATIGQVAQSLAQREDEEFILIYHDKVADEWVIELNSNMDGLLVASLLNVFQGQMLELMMQQHLDQKTDSEAGPETDLKRESA